MKDRRVDVVGPRASDDPLEGSWSLAYVDDLTGLYNRRLLTHLFEERWADLVARHPEFSLILIDLDRFKDVNDRYGHLAGDSVLKTAANLLRANFREKDLVIRYGGDEFVVLLPGAGRDVASTLAERARDAMTRQSFLVGEDARALEALVSFSLGVATQQRGGSSGEALLALADRQLYSEKRKRRARRWPVRVLGAIAALIVAGLLFTLYQPPEGVAPAPADPNRLLDADRQQLRQQIRELEAQLEALRSAMNRDGRDIDEAAAAVYEETIRALQEHIQRLQAKADGGSPETGSADPPVPERMSEPQVVARKGSTGDRSPRAPAQKPERAPVTRPVLVRRGRVSYPPLALQMGREAALRFRVQVGANGRATSADLLDPDPGLDFARSGRSVVLKARYKPATRAGIPVAGETEVIVKFELPKD